MKVADEPRYTGTMPHATEKHTLSAEAEASLKSFTALAKVLGFPRGAGTTDSTKGTAWAAPSCRLSWHKSGGHAGSKVVSRVVEAALKAGFVAYDHTRHDVPDGSMVGSGSTYLKHEGRGKNRKLVTVLSCSTRYGVVASENRYGLELRGQALPE